MKRRSLALLLTVAALVADADVAAAQPAASREAKASADEAKPGDEAKRADAFFQRGVRLYREKKYVEAEAALLSAWELSPTFDVAQNLGHTEYQLKKHREAAKYLAFALRHWPLMKAAATLKARVEQRLAESRAQVGAVTVTVGVVGAEVLVDGKVVGKAPLEGEVFVDPGEHQVEARMAGYATVSQAVRVGKGGTAEAALALVPVKSEAQEAARLTTAEGAPSAPAGAPAAEKPPVAPELPAPAPPERSWVPLIALGAASVVGLGVGVGLTVASRNARSDADAQRAAILSRGPGCVHAPSDVASACDAFEDTASRAEAFGTGALVAYAASGTLAAGALVYALWPRSATTGSTVGVRPSVSLAKGDAMVGVVGAW